MSVDDTLMCSFQILKPADKKKLIGYQGFQGRPTTPPSKGSGRGGPQAPNQKKK